MCMDGNNVKKDDENDQLDCGIYSSTAAARLLCRVGSEIAAAIARYKYTNLGAAVVAVLAHLSH